MNVSELLLGLDAVIVTAPPDLFFLSGIENADAIVLLTEKENLYIASPLYEVEAHRSLALWLTPMIVSAKEKTMAIRHELKGAKAIGMQLSSVDVETYNRLLQGLSAKVSDVSEKLYALRYVKSEREIELMTKAEAMVDAAFDKVLAEIAVGMTEKEVRNVLQMEMLRCGADGFAFDTIVAFGENAAKPHAVPSERRLRKGDCVVMDFGAKFGGYCSDFTRTVFCGAPSDKAREAYEVVLCAHKAALKYISDGGRSASEADRIARDVIDGSPFRGKFCHSLGHGVGVEIHEPPYLKPQSADVLTDGNVFTIEPGVYVEGEFGIRIESLAAIQNGKVTVIDRSNKEIITV